MFSPAIMISPVMNLLALLFAWFLLVEVFKKFGLIKSK